VAALKEGNECITFAGNSIGLSLGDFWRWSFSDLLDNTLRGIYSEFIVGAALGLDLSAGRTNWDPWDLTYQHDGQEVHIEVKSSAYLQPYQQEHLSNIVFSIRPTRTWDPAGGYSDEVRRQADVYVFCLYAEQDRTKANPLELDGWRFYVLPTNRLNTVCGKQKTLSLSALLNISPIHADFQGLENAVLEVIEEAAQKE
jgi:hypothetical protein